MSSRSRHPGHTPPIQPDPKPQPAQTSEEPRHSSGAAVSWPEYLSVRETARLLGVSERSVYGYLEKERLPVTHQGNLLVIETAAVHSFQRLAAGRPRVRQPEWHRSSHENGQVLTQVSVEVQAGQRQALEQRLAQIHLSNRHQLPGTIARYIAWEPRPSTRVKMVFIWRRAAMPPEGERGAALKALWDELDDLLAWKTMVIQECDMLLHT